LRSWSFISRMRGVLWKNWRRAKWIDAQRGRESQILG
jgi:hypothetical protein